MNDLIGTTLGQYEIREKIGQGGMATVFKAYHSSLDRFVAVKVLSPVMAEEVGFAERFQREARSIAGLQHPNILQVYDFGQEGKYYYIVMRYAEASRTLDDLIRKYAPLSQLIKYILQVADALNYAHERGIVHRDVKPSNILIDGEWALLSDFGLVKMATTSSELTGTGMTMGTPAYMSPEQAAGKNVDQRTDIYALGIILHRVLTGTIPHQAPTPLAIALKRSTEPVPPLRNIKEDIPESLEHVALRALALQPEARYSTAANFAEALQAAQANSDFRERIITEMTEGDATMFTDPIPPPKPWTKTPFATVIAAVVVVAGLLVFLLFLQPNRTAELDAAQLGLVALALIGLGFLVVAGYKALNPVFDILRAIVAVFRESFGDFQKKLNEVRQSRIPSENEGRKDFKPDESLPPGESRPIIEGKDNLPPGKPEPGEIIADNIDLSDSAILSPEKIDEPAQKDVAKNDKETIVLSSEPELLVLDTDEEDVSQVDELEDSDSQTMIVDPLADEPLSDAATETDEAQTDELVEREAESIATIDEVTAEDDIDLYTSQSFWREDGVIFVEPWQEAVKIEDDSEYPVLIPNEIRAILSESSNHLIETWLKGQDVEQLGYILSKETNARLLLTGYGSFGGTSLVRGVTAKLMLNFAERQTGKVLVIRLETRPHAPQGYYELFINENHAGPVKHKANEARLTKMIRGALSRQANTINPQAVDIDKLNTFFGLSGVFDQALEEAEELIQRSKTVTNLVRQVLKLLESDYRNTELQQALNGLFSGPESGQTGQIILTIDRIDHPVPMSRLLDSVLMSDPRLSVIVVSRREQYNDWPQELRDRLSPRGFKEHYVRRLWERDLDLTHELGRILQIDPAAGGEKDQRRLSTFLSHLTYNARGSMALAMRELRTSHDWSVGGKEAHIFDLAARYVRERERIEHNAHIQKILQQNWDEILGSLFNEPHMTDQARIGVYYIIDWIVDQAIFSEEELKDVAGELTIPISHKRYIREMVLTKLLGVLEEHHYLEQLTEPDVYMLAWRQQPTSLPEDDHLIQLSPPSLPLAREADLKKEGHNVIISDISVSEIRPLNIALLSDTTMKDNDTANALITQIAFETIEAGHRLITIDCPTTEMAIRQKLISYWPLHIDDFNGVQQPVVLTSTNHQLVAHTYEEVIESSSAVDQLRQLMKEADVIIMVRQEETIEPIYSSGNVELIASGQGVPIIPIGAASGETATLWTKANNNLSDHYEGRISTEDFAKIGPDQNFVPDIARSAIALARQACMPSTNQVPIT